MYFALMNRWMRATTWLSFLITLAAGTFGPLIRQQAQTKEGLQALAAQRDFYIGAAIAVDPLRREPSYRETLQREFNAAVAENAFKFDALHPARDRYDFKDADLIADFAQRNGMKLRGHTLVWHKQLPAWVTNGSFTRAEAIALMRDHITTVMTHFRGKVWAWDVVNEAMEGKDEPLRTDSFWYQKIGPDYIRLAFEFARAADPDAILYYNDFDAEDMGTRSKHVYNLVRDLKQRGTPIDGVGWQMHIDDNFKINGDHRKNARRLGELGLELSITELDVRTKTDGTPSAKQSAVYRDVATFCLTEPNCRAVILWGVTDKHSWVPAFFPGYGDALIFDADYRPKPAYAALRDALQTAITAPPIITAASFAAGKLTVTGQNFDRKSVVWINGKPQKTEADKAQPTTKLTIKKADPAIAPSQAVKLHVQNPDGKLSRVFDYK